MTLSDIIPQKNDHSIFMGQTESGKTTLAEFIIRNYSRKYRMDNIVVMDLKGKIGWEGFRVITQFKTLVEAKQKHLIYCPCVDEAFDKEYWEKFFRWIYLRQNTICYVDEVSAVTKKQVIPTSYLHCMARGREMNIAMFNATQRPKDIPASIISESKNKYVFYLQLEGDRKRASEFTGIKSVQIGSLRNHRFYYANLSVESPFGPLYLDQLPEKTEPEPAPAPEPEQNIPDTGPKLVSEQPKRTAADLLLGKKMN